METRKILVTGGLGTVGRPLTDELRARGHDVWTLDRPHSSDSRHLRGDVGEFRQLERAFEAEKFDTVYHLAAEFGRHNGEAFYETLWRSNAVGTKNLLVLQRDLRFQMVFFSSSEVYGDYAGTMSEDVLDKLPIRQLNDYAMSKRVNEMQIAAATQAWGTETLIVRLFNTYGPGEHYTPYRNAVCVFIYHALKNLPYTVYTKHRRSFTYIDDAVHTLANIVRRFRPREIYNIAGTELVDMKSASDLVLRATGRSSDLAQLMDIEPATTIEKRVDVTKAIRDLGHSPRVNLEEGVKRTVDWQRGVYGQG